MRLTLVNFIVRKRPYGHKYRGKNREVRPVPADHLRHQYDHLALQEQNMLYLRHPYITVEQSRGHMYEVKKDVKKLWNIPREEKFSKKKTWAEQLGHLRVRDAWE